MQNFVPHIQGSGQTSVQGDCVTMFKKKKKVHQEDGNKSLITLDSAFIIIQLEIRSYENFFGKHFSEI